VSAHEFVFTLQLSHNATVDEMLRDLATRVLGHVGCAADAVDAVVGSIDATCARTAANAPCRMHFSARAGELHVAIRAGDREWHTTEPLP